MPRSIYLEMTIFIIILNITLSFLAFKGKTSVYQWGLMPYQMTVDHSYYRFITSGFFHSGWAHLIINMLVLWSFGSQVESVFSSVFQNSFIGKTVFMLFYLSAIPAASISSFIKHRHNPDYLAIGASGAVSAVVFCSILFNPLSKLLILPIPIPIPAIIFGIAYLIYSWYMGKHGQDNIGHDAHFWGAVYGIIVSLIIEPSSGKHFITIICNSLHISI